MERLADIRGEFSDVLLAGCPNPAWPRRFGGSNVTVIDPGPKFALRADGSQADLEAWPLEPASFDLCLCIGLLDTANHLELAAAALHWVLKPGGLLLGAISGGHSLPRLRAAMLAADAASDQASPRVHPRIEAPSLGQLLSGAGFAMPVVDVDRVDIAYRSLDALVKDLRGMGATNILAARSRRPLTRTALQVAKARFLGGGERATEQVEILHFAAWKPG